jgi:hypothetical protein
MSVAGGYCKLPLKFESRAELSPPFGGRLQLLLPNRVPMRAQDVSPVGPHESQRARTWIRP